ncbi:drebrin-like protein B isoform X2 [Silurus meridionalis]|uniref:drebrin-like protein B isoform X2 n=1 Tax=Silurus meridionalis TaxID=175797 RepID=UPI001EE9CB30|nr:drebrin-like protein B isoform X2 [Silurus meridionalis]
MQAINLDTFSLSLLTAKEDIVNGRASTDWALFAYEGFTNNLKLFDSGTGGLIELAQKFHIAKPMYGLCRITLHEVGQPQIVLICWVGEDVDEFRKTECASHVPAVKSFFKEANAFIHASNKDELTEEKITAILEKVRPPMERFRRNSRQTEKEETVGTNYRKTNAALEMRRINRDTFWAHAEREEEERKEEERKKAAEDRRRRERERVLKERKEAEERDRKMNEKLQMIEEQRRLDAKRQEENRRHEKSKWEMQQREHEEEMRARLRRSESIEKAAEAAALISQRSLNPREFFRQLSQSSISPVSPSTGGKPPFRRYQRSLTDTAFIFERASASSGPTSPLSPTVTSPFSQTPTSPFNRCTSPPSPSFRPITSPQSPRAPVRTPPTPPITECSAPPISSLPSLPDSKASPPLSTIPSLSEDQVPIVPESSNLVQSESTSVVREQEPVPVTPSAPPPEIPAPLKESVSEHLIDIFMPSETDEELNIVVGPEVKAEEAQLPLEACTICLPPSETSTSSQDPAVAEQAVMPRSEPFAVSLLIEVEEPIEEEEEEQEGAEETAEVEEQAESESSASDEPTLMEEIHTVVRTEAEVYVEESKNFLIEEEIPDQNGICPQNAKEYDDSSDHSTPDKCTYIVNREDTDEEDGQSEEAENVQSSAGGPLLRVRALYDYQAEDDTEISFEPGDIIMDVETVDKAWWRGLSKDGRQGLFPSNYVETI